MQASQGAHLHKEITYITKLILLIEQFIYSWLSMSSEMFTSSFVTEFYKTDPNCTLEVSR